MKKTILLLCSILLCQLSIAQQVSIPNVIKGITVMVVFQNYPMNDPIQAVNELMNKPGYNANSQIGSVRDYFYTQTSGKVTITSTVVKVAVSNTFEYYTLNKVNYVDEAIDLINQNYPDGFQNLTPDPIDGKLLHINFVSRAPGHSSTNGASAGKFVKNNTNAQMEVGQGNMTFFGPTDPLITNTICHEMGHSVMSWTDYYQTAFSNVGGYGVMGSGGTDIAPQPINPALRMQRGWIDNIIPVLGTNTQTYTLNANSYTTIHKYTNPNNSKEYLLFHALKATGGYYQTQLEDKTLSDGLAIWYVDEESGYDSPINPTDDNQYFIRLVQADNKDEMHDDFFGATDVRGDLEDLYGNANKSFPNGTPFRWKDGGEFGINITNISNPGTTMQFTVNARPSTVLATSDINGTLSPKGTLAIANGQNQTFNLTPNPGYEIDQIKINGSVVATANPFVLTGISGTQTVSVSFKRKATQPALPSQWQKTAIGSVSNRDFVANSGTNYFLETHQNTVEGSADNFTYLYQVINGNGTYIAHLSDYNTTQKSHVGLMIRESLLSSAAFGAITKYDLGGAVVRQRAYTGGGIVNNPNDTKELHRYVLQNWLKIVRNGNHIQYYTSKDGSDWYEMGDQTISLPTQAYIGLFISGGTSAYPSQARFDNISFTTNPSPSVSITTPINNAVLINKFVTVNAIATPSTANGSISNVKFYNGSTLLATDNTAPFSFVWNNAPGGIQTIVAKATDNTGAVAVSLKVAINIPCASVDPKITGTVIGTPGSWNMSGNTRDKAFDGNINTYFDAPIDIAWTGLSLATAYKITGIRYVPRQGLEGRMNGGKFQGSNTEDFSSGVIDLAVVLAAPKSGWNCFDVFTTESFKYIRYLSPEGGVGNVSEVEFYGTVQVINQAPTVTLTNPISNSTFTAPAMIPLSATASDTDGSIWRVEFYNGTTLLGTDYNAPFEYIAFNLAPGAYSIKAIAFDDAGLASQPSVSVINVVENEVPRVTIITPLSYSRYSAPATIHIDVTATDADGTITKVDFYNGSILLGSDYTAPYSFTWNNVTAGVYNITALAIDNYGATTSSTRNSIAVIANQSPTVNITSPLTNASYAAPATIVIHATAADADGSVTKVDFYNGSTLLGSDLTAPYSFTWSNVPAGIYNITALAIDNLNNTASSTRNNIAVAASTANITGPACASTNSTIGYELAPSKRVNATSYGWYFTGSTQSFTPSSVNPYQVTLMTGNYFGSGQLCVGVSYSSGPYTTYCITIPKCSSNREGSMEEWSEVSMEIKKPVVFPNPFTGETTINFDNSNQTATIHVYNATGILVDEAIVNGTYTFGQNLTSGIYFAKINIGSKIETLKLVKE